MAVSRHGHLGGSGLRSSGLALGREGPVAIALPSLGLLLLLDLLLLLLDLVLVQLRGGVPAAVYLRDGKVPGALCCKHSTTELAHSANLIQLLYSNSNSKIVRQEMQRASLAPRSSATQNLPGKLLNVTQGLQAAPLLHQTSQETAMAEPPCRQMP